MTGRRRIKFYQPYGNFRLRTQPVRNLINQLFVIVPYDDRHLFKDARCARRTVEMQLNPFNQFWRFCSPEILPIWSPCIFVGRTTRHQYDSTQFGYGSVRNLPDRR